jgi:hypothetical protein
MNHLLPPKEKEEFNPLDCTPKNALEFAKTTAHLFYNEESFIQTFWRLP